MSKVIKILSENDIFQNIETLRRNRDKRNKRNEFLFEGVRNINNAIKHNWKINSFIYSPEKPLSSWAQEILSKSKNAARYELTLRLLQKLSGKDETSELMVTVEIPKDDLKRIPLKENLLVVVFDRPSSPGNLGTIIRSCDAMGAHGLIITGHAVDMYDPETVSATTGSLFSVPVIRIPSQTQLTPWLEETKEKFGHVQLVGTDESGEVEIDQHDFKKPTVLLVGNETSGLSVAYKEMCDAIVKIPMHGTASSLNVASATSIVLYEINRQRKA